MLLKIRNPFNRLTRKFCQKTPQTSSSWLHHPTSPLPGLAPWPRPNDHHPAAEKRFERYLSPSPVFSRREKQKNIQGTTVKYGRNPAKQLRLIVYPHYLQGFYTSFRWLFGISSTNSMSHLIPQNREEEPKKSSAPKVVFVVLMVIWIRFCWWATWSHWNSKLIKYVVEPLRGPEGYPKWVYSVKLRYRQVFVDPKWIQIGLIHPELSTAPMLPMYLLSDWDMISILDKQSNKYYQANGIGCTHTYQASLTCIYHGYSMYPSKIAGQKNGLQKGYIDEGHRFPWIRNMAFQALKFWREGNYGCIYAEGPCIYSAYILLL